MDLIPFNLARTPRCNFIAGLQERRLNKMGLLCRHHDRLYVQKADSFNLADGRLHLMRVEHPFAEHLEPTADTGNVTRKIPDFLEKTLFHKEREVRSR